MSCQDDLFRPSFESRAARTRNTYKYISTYIKMDVCLCVCTSITLERLERFRPNLVYGCMYVCIKILYILYVFSYLLSIIFSREDGAGGLHGIHPPGVTNRCRGNVYANRYRSNSAIVCVVLEHTYKHASICV
jgi:hypothetical protein